MQIDGVDIVKLGFSQSPPSDSDLVAEIKQEKSGGYTAQIVSGLLFKETIPGTHSSIDAALGATIQQMTQRRQIRTLYYKGAGGARRVIKKTRYVRSY